MTDPKVIAKAYVAGFEEGRRDAAKVLIDFADTIATYLDKQESSTEDRKHSAAAIKVQRDHVAQLMLLYHQISELQFTSAG